MLWTSLQSWVVPTWVWMTELCVQLCKTRASVSTSYLTSWLTGTSSEKSYFCVPENRQGDKIAIPVRYAPVNCSSVHHLFSYEGSFFFPFSFFTQSWVWKEKLWCKQKGHGGANPSRQSEKEQLQKALQYHSELYKAEKKAMIKSEMFVWR